MSKMNKKKVISVLFSLVLASSLAACSGTAQARPELTAGTAAASNLTASNIAASGSSDRQAAVTPVSTNGTQAQNCNLGSIVKAAAAQNKTACPNSSAAVKASNCPNSAAANTASQPTYTAAANTSNCPNSSAAVKASSCPNSAAANTAYQPSYTAAAKASNCPTANNSQAAAILASLCGKNAGSILGNSVSSGSKLPCSVYFCQGSICGKINCNTATCVTPSCKSNSCGSGTGTTSSSGNSGSAGSAVTPNTGTSSGSASTAGQSNTSIANQVLQLINAERAKNGLAALSMNANAQKAAQVRANEIVTQFSHTRPNGQSCFTALKEFNVSYSTAGENIAYGQPDAKTVVNAWMNSSGHRANILNGSFKQTGIGVYKDSRGVYYWTQEFIG